MLHVIIADAHLTSRGSARVADDIARVVAAHPGANIVLAGDTLDLAAESVAFTSAGAIDAIMAAHPVVRRSLAQHVERDGSLLLLAGNHDDALATPEGLDRFATSLGIARSDRVRLTASPWFARLGPDGALHVEHGHHYDADNALPHPLAPPDPAWRSLGIGLMHDFVAPSGAHALVHANDGTPLQLLARAVQIFGPRAPQVIARYFSAAYGQWSRSGARFPADLARTAGTERLEVFASRWALEPAVADTLVGFGATPTLSSARDTFLRLYWDRVLALSIAAASSASALAGGPGGGLAIAASAALVGSIAVGRNRYRGRAPRALATAAARVAATTGARAVVFGHVHAAMSAGSYTNAGSFAFPNGAPGRPYVRVDDERWTVERLHQATG